MRRDVRSSLRGLQLQPLGGVAGSTAKFDLSFFLLEAADGFTVRVEYNTDLFDESTIERMLRHYQVLLEGALANPELRHLATAAADRRRAGAVAERLECDADGVPVAALPASVVRAARRAHA